MELSGNVPFTVKPVDDRRVVVRFARFCDHPRRAGHEKALNDLVERYDAIALDLSETENIGSDWLRWLNLLAIRADKAGKTLAAAGAREDVREMTDFLSIDVLKLVDRVEEVWAS